MTQNNPGYATLNNKRRVAGPYTKFNFGLVKINWDVRPGPNIVLKALGADGF